MALARARRGHGELSTLRVLCDAFALVLLVLAGLLPPSVPHRDRMAYTGLALWLLPIAVHALQTH